MIRPWPTRCLPLAFLLSALAAQSSRPASLPTDVAAWRTALHALEHDVLPKHPKPFFDCDEAKWRAARRELDTALEGLTTDQRTFRLWALVRMLGDGHTDLAALRARLQEHVWPVRLRWLEGAVRVAQTRPETQDLLAAEVLAIGPHTIGDLLTALRGIFRPDTEAMFCSGVIRDLASMKDLLVAAGLLAREPRTAFRCKLVDGSTVTRELETLPAPPPESTWQGPARTTLLVNRNPERIHFVELLSDRKVGYLRYRRCADDPAHPVQELVQELVAWLEAGKIDRVIVDLRANGGGNSAVLGGLGGFGPLRMLATHAALGSPANLLVLIDGGTFSSAWNNAIQARELGCQLVGEPTGQAMAHYGEVKVATLPGIDVVMTHSSAFRGIARNASFHASLEPHVLVAPTVADWLAPRDTILEAALALPRKK